MVPYGQEECRFWIVSGGLEEQAVAMQVLAQCVGRAHRQSRKLGFEAGRQKDRKLLFSHISAT